MAEEAGLLILPQSIQEYGSVHRAEKNSQGELFVQDNYYYFCKAAPQSCPQRLDDYEAEEGFVLEFVSPMTAIHTNREQNHGPTNQTMLEREARVLELLMEEGFLPLPHKPKKASQSN